MHYKNYSLKSIVAQINGVIYTEQWLPIIGFEGLYEISTFGRVKHVSNTIKGHRNIFYTTKEFIMHIHRDQRYGYCQLELTKNKIGATKKVHRLVALAFVQNPENLPQVNHIDGDKTNNHISNLEWANNSMNQIHAYKLGLRVPKTGEDHCNSKISNLQAVEIVNKYKLGIKVIHLAKMYNVNRITIYRIINLKRVHEQNNSL